MIDAHPILMPGCSVDKSYPWIRDGKMIVPQGSKELIEMRQKIFFGKPSERK